MSLSKPARARDQGDLAGVSTARSDGSLAVGGATARLVEFLRISVEMRALALAAWHPEDLTRNIAEQVVLDHGGLPTTGLGVPLVGRPEVAPGMSLGAPGRCFTNAYRAMSDDLLYTEGWAAQEGPGGIPIYHAWLTAPDGRVFDPTWARTNPDLVGSYLGVRFTPRFMRDHVDRAGFASVLEGNSQLFERGLIFTAEHVACGYSSDPTHSVVDTRA